MNEPVETSYQPPAAFSDHLNDPLIDLDSTDSTELWLFQWPVNQPPDFDGLLVPLKFRGDGRMGNLEGSSGRSYEVVSYKSQGPEGTLFLNSETEAEIAAKVCRRVSLIHYPEPDELQRRNNPSLSHSQRSSSTPSRSVRPTKSSISGFPTPGSRKRSSASGFGESSRPPKKKRPEQSKSTSHSGKGNIDRSQETKSKKNKSKLKYSQLMNAESLRNSRVMNAESIS